jgi:hypothetical protein
MSQYALFFLVSDLPYSITGGQLIQFEGLPTFVGGINENTVQLNDEIYQYHWTKNKWIKREDVELKEKAIHPAAFEVPRDIFGLC